MFRGSQGLMTCFPGDLATSSLLARLPKAHPMPQCYKGVWYGVPCTGTSTERAACAVSAKRRASVCFYHAVNMLLRRVISVKPAARLSVSV